MAAAAPSPPPWYKQLATTLTKNYKSQERVILQLHSTSRDGKPSFHPLQLSEINTHDPRYLVLLMPLNDAKLRGDVTSNPKSEMTWQLPHTRDIYRFHGRFYIVPCNRGTFFRFPPPQLTDQDAQKYWEAKRLKAWSNLSDSTRASFAWPPRGQVRSVTSSTNHGFEHISVTSADAHMDSYKILKMKDLSNAPASEQKTAHDHVRDGEFCLLVYRVDMVEWHEMDVGLTGGDERGVPRRIDWQVREGHNVTFWEQTDITP